jgi:RNA polymerase sigma factor for flagellar operon FliA
LQEQLGMQLVSSTQAVTGDARQWRDRLVAMHMPLARRIVRGVARRVPAWLSPDDLESAALLGLVEAAHRFDPARGESFAAYATPRIRGAVVDELRRGDLMTRRARREARRAGETITLLRQRLGREPEDVEVAAALQLPVEEYREAIEGLTQVSVVELSPTLERRLIDATDGADSTLARAELIERVHAALAQLPPRDVEVLRLRYLDELGYADIGRRLGVTESRVCQLHGRAIAALRAALA